MMAPADSKSGSQLDFITDQDGRRLVVKRESPDRDWLLLALNDTGRLVSAWDAGLFDHLPASIDCPIEQVERTDDGWTVVMRDVSDTLLDPARRLSRAENRLIFAAVADLHAAFRDVTPPDGLCTLRDRYTFLGPARARQLADRHEVPRVALTGWERFADVVPDDVSTAVLALVDDPSPLIDAMARRPVTLIHGDLKFGNLGLDGRRLVLVDWGCWLGMAPPATSYVWYISLNATRVDASLDDILDDARAAEGHAHDEEGLRLAILANLVQNGWDKALSATADDEAVRAREQAQVDWWVGEARTTLESWTEA